MADFINEYKYPMIDLLNDYHINPSTKSENIEEINAKVEIIKEAFKDFNIDAIYVKTIIGPAFSKIIFKISNIKTIKNIKDIENDLSIRLAKRIRINDKLIGNEFIGIEIENKKREIIPIKEAITDLYKEKSDDIKFIIGYDELMKPKYISLNDLPHLLIAGSSGSGKSILLNDILAEIMYLYSPSDLKVILVDLKMVEFREYQRLPHLYNDKIVNDADEALVVLESLVEEMNRRYKIFLENKVSNIKEYNEKVQKLPRIIVFIDEYIELTISSNNNKIKECIKSLVMKSRAAGIHLLISAQKLDSRYMDSIIKSNIPSRISFKVSSAVDSKNILDETGAEKLLGYGDMIFKDYNSINRYQAPFVSNEEILKIIENIKE